MKLQNKSNMKRIVIAVMCSLLSLVAVAQQNISGTYSYKLKATGTPSKTEKIAGPTGKLVLLKMEGNKYRFWLDVTVGAPSYNAGETDGTITFVNDTASFDNTFEGASQSCILKFKITNNTIRINSQSSSYNCGFGNGVTADGNYTRKKTQPLINNAWLKKEYHESPTMIITASKAEIFQDENCLHSLLQKKYFVKGEKILNISETGKTIYTEFISPSGKFLYGWLKKTDLKNLTAE